MSRSSEKDIEAAEPPSSYAYDKENTQEKNSLHTESRNSEEGVPPTTYDKEITEKNKSNYEDPELTDSNCYQGTNNKNDDNNNNNARENQNVEFSVFSLSERRFIAFMGSWAGFFSPVSSQIYYPALDSLTKDLSVSITLINLTLTSYMVN